MPRHSDAVTDESSEQRCDSREDKGGEHRLSSQQHVLLPSPHHLSSQQQHLRVRPISCRIGEVPVLSAREDSAAVRFDKLHTRFVEAASSLQERLECVDPTSLAKKEGFCASVRRVRANRYVISSVNPNRT